MADISKITVNNTQYNIKDTTARTGNIETSRLVRPAKLNGVADNTIIPQVDDLRANRLAFLPADQIIIEKTTDGGTTWEDAGVSDATKLGLFSQTRAGIIIPLLNGVKDIRCGLRVTITAMRYDVPSGTAETQKYNYWNSTYVKSTERYNQLREMYFWVNSNADAIKVTVQRATGANPNNWVTIFDRSDYGMTGWSGNDYVSFSQGVFGGDKNQTGNYWNYRLIFMTCGANGSSTLSGYNPTSSQGIYEIRGYGTTWWAAGNRLASSDHMYSWDANQNVTFPAQVTATNFAGTLNGKTLGVSVPADAKFTDTTYVFDGTYDASTNKAATVSTVTTAVGAKADKTDTVLETSLSRGRKASTTVGTGSFAFGNDVTASGIYAHAEGFNTSATGSYSHAEGGGTVAKVYSHAEGYMTKATGDCSHAEGNYTTASEEYAHAEGRYTTSSGHYSHAEGNYTTSSGMASHAEGTVTVANHANQHVFGEYNVADASSATALSRGNYVEIVGNGTDSNAQSNARALDWDGNEYLMGDLYVGCDEDSTGGTKVVTSAFTGATSSSAGAIGLVPAPASGDHEKFLCANGTWATVSGGSANSGLYTVSLDNVVQTTSGSYTHTTTVSDMTGDMKAVNIECSNPLIFLSQVNIATSTGGVTLSCSNVAVGESTVKVSFVVVGNFNPLSSMEYNALDARIGNLSDLDTSDKTDIVSAINEANARSFPLLTPSVAFNIPSVGTPAVYNMEGMTENHELIRWNFSESSENAPPVSLEWATYNGYFVISNLSGETNETMKPVFAETVGTTITTHTE